MVTQGQTLDETVANLKDAVALYLEGEAPPPQPCEKIREHDGRLAAGRCKPVTVEVASYDASHHLVAEVLAFEARSTAKFNNV